MTKSRPNDTAWTMPAELEHCTPRQVELAPAGWALSIVATLIAVAGAIALPTGLLLERQAKEALRKQIAATGISAVAEITRSGRTTEDQPKRFADYQYSIDGRIFKRRVSFEDSDHRSLATGAQLPIRYLPSKPQQSWVVGYEPWGAPLPVIVLLPLAFGVGAIAIAAAIQRQRSLLEEGRATSATITDVTKKHIRREHDHYRVEYEFRLMSGAVKRIKLQSKKEPAKGATVTLIYDRENPRKAIRYPFPLVRIARF